MFWVYQGQKSGHFSSQLSFKNYTLYSMLYLESMKIILKIPLKVCFVGEWEVISEEFMQKKATN